MAAFTQGKRLDEIPIASAMSRQVHSTFARYDIEHAEEIMRTKQIRRIPVLDEQNRVVGVLSLGDIARALSGRGSNGLSPPALAQALSQISQPGP